MACELGDIACVSGDIHVQAISNGEEYIFIVPKEAVLDLLQEESTFDCAQFVLENTEVFEDIADALIADQRPEEPMLVTQAVLEHYFYH